MEIRPATADDWPQIWPFFSSIVADGQTYAYPLDLTIESGESWWMEQWPARTVVMVDGDKILGSAKMGPNRPGRGSHIATASFLVDPSVWGTGVGRALGSYAVEWAKAAGYAGMQFNAVVETNHAAIGLWKALGFSIIGTAPGAFDSRVHGPVGLHIMFQKF